jgi:hypothetical protein
VGTSTGARGSAPTPHEREIAAAPGSSPEQIRARRKVAKDFYLNNDKKYVDGRTGTVVSSKVRSADARSQMRGIDFKKPVKVGPPPPLGVQDQWQRPKGYQGNYYADPGTPTSKLGIHHSSKDPASGAIQPKITKQYKPDPSTPYLESSAGKIDDTWSIPGQTKPATGGGKQRYVPDNTKVKPYP